jgi:hypothetical protein
MSTMSEQQLKIVGVAITRVASVADIARGTAPRLNVTVEVENLGDTQLYVWTDCRARTYDAATHVLSLQLAEPTIVLPPHIKLLSDHPRKPIDVAVDGKTSARIKLQLPGTTRRLTPGQGIGRSFTDDPIGPIDRVDIAVQYGTEPVQTRVGEATTDFRARLRAYGSVAHASVAPTEVLPAKGN